MGRTISLNTDQVLLSMYFRCKSGHLRVSSLTGEGFSQAVPKSDLEMARPALVILCGSFTHSRGLQRERTVATVAFSQR